jgi:hypothetical protein
MERPTKVGTSQQCPLLHSALLQEIGDTPGGLCFLVYTKSFYSRHHMATFKKGFEFIDGTSCDRSTRRQARSHAMKGINAGRKITRRSRLVLGSLPAAKHTVALYDDNRPHLDLDSANRSGSTMQASRGKATGTNAYDIMSVRLLSNPLPINVSANSRYVIRECTYGLDRARQRC